MRSQHFPLTHIAVFLLLLLTGKLNFLSHARPVNREAKTWKSEHSAPSMGYFPKRAPFREHVDDRDDDDDFSPIYGVSKRLVPQGPNPLHN